VKKRGNVQKLAAELGVAYNTARARLDAIVTVLGGTPETNGLVDRRLVLDRLASKEILSGVGFFQDRVPMRSSPHPPSPLLPHGEQGEPPQIPLPDAVRSPSPAQGEGFGVRAPAKNPTPASQGDLRRGSHAPAQRVIW
jgi:hypothetical protein